MNNTRIGMFLVGLLILLLTAVHAGATTVSIADEAVESDGVVTIPIMVNEITDYGSGTINIEYNSSVVHVTAVTSSPDSQVGACNPNNTIGLVQITAANVNGANGDIAFANVEFTAVGNSGDWTPLDLTVVSLYDRSFNKISATVSDGSITIGAAANPQLCTDPDPPTHDFGSVSEGQTRTWTFDITNCGGGTLEWTVGSDQSWITVDPASGSTTTGTDTVTVTINTTGLTAGSTYNGDITVTSDHGTKTGTISVSILLSQTDPQLCTTPDPPTHDFGSVSEGETRTWTFDVTNCGGAGTLTWTVSDDSAWITVDPTSGTDAGTVTVTIDTAGLSDGMHTGTVTVASDYGTETGTITVDVQSTQVDPKLCADPEHNFGTVQKGQTRTGTFDVTNCGGAGTLTWTVNDDQSWITVDPTSGTDAGTVTVAIDTASLSPGTHTGTVTVESNGGTKTGTITVKVTGSQPPPPPSTSAEVPTFTPLGMLAMVGLLGVAGMSVIKRR